MMSHDHVRLMARYNQWQNRNLYGAADGLGDEARRADRGAFFSSIHGKLSHLMWGDMIWMHRFAGTPRPEGDGRASAAAFSDWEALKTTRASIDATIIDWARQLDPAWLAGDMTWFSGAAGKELTRLRWMLVAHFFNHQTHHRGQVHAMLTAAGAKPGDTDLIVLESS